MYFDYFVQFVFHSFLLIFVFPVYLQIAVHRELHTMIVPEVFKEDAGNFMVRATNIAGEAKCYASLSVKPGLESHVVKTRLVEESHTVQMAPVSAGVTHAAPEFMKTFSDMRVRAGESAKFEITITGNPKPRVSDITPKVRVNELTPNQG